MFVCLCVYMHVKGNQGRTTHGKEGGKVVEIREATVNDKKFLRSDILKCHQAEVSLDSVVRNMKASWQQGWLSLLSALHFTLGISP